ncbi:D-alanyl-D-alanine carboxypeptidase family protein [Paenibacillus sp. EPM92]|uniref:D-alanyl-D-alanine carboxypeptidase family protein n=1 Tax=Paenibacillus sp. EPM92 TaxID=1561195 RepID=UPI0019166781|nr:D-alanyl-D-alanine carboxypeptidase family protein [Paenibacillus sp. EPM92]
MKWIRRMLLIGITAVILAIGWPHLDRLKPAAAFAWRSVSSGEFLKPGPVIQGEAAVLVNGETGELLFSKRASERMYPASTTKVMTALIALERLKPEDRITVGDEVSLRTPGESSAGLTAGQKLTLRDLIAAMMLPSGNDAARTVAVHVARKSCGAKLKTREAMNCFAKLMNERAKQLGADDSHFVNPHGLHDPDHYSTAHDLAIIAVKAMEQPEFRRIVAEPEHRVAGSAGTGSTVSSSGSPAPQRYTNRNLLVQPSGGYYFQGANGVKTGFTDEAGYCLVASAQRGGTQLISVVLRSTQSEVWTDSTALLTYGFGKSS